MMLLVFVFFSQDLDLQHIYDYATTSLVQFKTEKDSAFSRLISLAQDSLYEDTVMDYLISQFDTKSASERHALKDMMLKIGSSSIPFIVSRIDYRGSDVEDRCLKQSLWVLGEIGGEEIVEPAARFIDDRSWSIRSNAYTALGKSKSAEAVPYILNGLDDSIASVRKSAYYALSDLATIDQLEILIKGLSDEFYGVRYACVKGLKHIGAPAIEGIEAALVKKQDKYFYLAALVQIPEAQDRVYKYLNAADAATRYLIYEHSKEITMLEMAAEWETNFLLREYISIKTKELIQ